MWHEHAFANVFAKNKTELNNKSNDLAKTRSTIHKQEAKLVEQDKTNNSPAEYPKPTGQQQINTNQQTNEIQLDLYKHKTWTYIIKTHSFKSTYKCT